MEMPPDFAALICVRLSREISTSSAGRATSSFIKSRIFVPPAKKLASWFAETALAAVTASAAFEYLNGRILFVLLVKFPCLRAFFARVNFANRGQNVRVRAAAADIARHSFADFVVGKLERARLLPDIFR